MMKRESFPVAKIYVPTERRKTRDQKRVDEIAESMLNNGQLTPIKVRADGERFVLIEGGPIRDKIFSMLLPREQTHVGVDTGIGVLVKIDRSADIRGKPLP